MKDVDEEEDATELSGGQVVLLSLRNVISEMWGPGAWNIELARPRTRNNQADSSKPSRELN